MHFTYQEAVFTIPFSKNRNDTHQLVKHAFTMGDEIERREYIYDCHPIAGQHAITIRGKVLPSHLNPATKELRFELGDIRTFTLTINPTKNNKKTGRTDVISDSVGLAIEKLNHSGWEVINATQIKSELFSIQKRNYRKHRSLIVSKIKVTAKVIDPAKAEHAFIKGLGKAKTYGCGLIYAGKIDV